MLTAQQEADEQAREALSKLCETYWRPLYAFVRRRGYSRHDAEDLIQSFLLQLIDKRYLDSVDQEKGRFRSFLLVAIKHFAANRWARESTQKRGGTFQHFSLDYEDAEQQFVATDTIDPQRQFERRWALTVLQRVLDNLRQQFEQAGKLQQFEHLEPFLGYRNATISHCELAERLGMSEGAVRTAVHRLRRRYRQELRAEVAQTVARPEDVDDELQQLMAALSRD